jgi:hypothetical protein
MRSLAKYWPKPKCCHAIRRFPLVIAESTRVEDQDGSPTVRWTWRYEYPDSQMEVLGYSRIGPPDPTHCPFCQTKLPEFRRKAKPPEPLCLPGDHYCLTCNERLMNCECYPAECGWEVCS